MNAHRHLALTLALALAACGGSEGPPEPAKEAAPAKESPAGPTVQPVPPQIAAMFKPVEAIPVPDAKQALVDLGRMLYYEERLSAGQNQSCNTCHQLENYGVDNEPTSPGSFGERGARNSPTSYYAYGHVAQFWDGRAADLAAQAKGPILNPVEMAIPDEAYALKVLHSIPGYVDAFGKAFPGEADPITYDHLADAIAAFESHLVTPSPFDAWLAGQPTTMTEAQRKGAEAFVATGCTACHMGPFLGGAMYQKLGLVEPYETKDLGRMEVTGNESDKHVFKVPSLRNIAKTGPYYHDGSVATLDDAVRLMAKHQLGRALTADEIGSIVAFLESLTGEIPTEFVAKPSLPASGPETPGPMPKG